MRIVALINSKHKRLLSDFETIIFPGICLPRVQRKRGEKPQGGLALHHVVVTSVDRGCIGAGLALMEVIMGHASRTSMHFWLA